MKKSNRFRVRRALVWSAWGLVLLAGLAGLFVWHSFELYDRSIENFELYVGPASHQSYLREGAADGENAAVAFASAMADVELSEDWTRALEPAAWSAAERVEARRAIEGLADVLDSLDAASGLENCAWPSYSEPALSWSGPMLQASRLLKARGFVGALEKDEALIQSSFDSLGALAECLYSQPQLVGSLVATAVDRARLELVRAALATAGLEPELFSAMEAGLRQSLESDRVAWAIAAEGAFALRFIENPALAGEAPGRGSTYPIFSKRVSAHLAERWVELKAWSELSLDELIGEDVEPVEARGAMVTVVADVLIPNIRHGVVKMRAIEELTELGLTAIEGWRSADEQGTYDGAFAAHPGLATLPEGSGGILVHAPGLEALLRDHHFGPGAESPGAEATLALTSWRLPPLRQSRPSR